MLLSPMQGVPREKLGTSGREKVQFSSFPNVLLSNA